MRKIKELKMKLELELPESTIKKIKAWSLLSDYSGSADDALVLMLEKALSDEIRRCLDLPKEEPRPESFRTKQALSNYNRDFEKATVLKREPEVQLRPENLIVQDTSLELGDSYEEGYDADGGSDDEEAFVPHHGGLNESDLDRDMLVEDPEHEAISSGSGYEDFNSSAEDLFSSQLNLPKVPRVDPGVMRRDTLRRNTQNKRRARVTNYSGGE
jgi:hypothetical protein